MPRVVSRQRMKNIIDSISRVIEKEQIEMFDITESNGHIQLSIEFLNIETMGKSSLEVEY